MLERRGVPTIAISLALGLLVLVAGGAWTQAWGQEFQVNTYTTDYQDLPAIAANAQGSVVVTWRSNGQDGSFNGVFAQRFNGEGGVGGEFQVNSYTTSQQVLPTAGMDGSGNFVIAWQSYAQDGSFGGIFAQRFDSSGAALGTEFRVNSYTTGGQAQPALAMNGNGDFVVAWRSDGQDGDGRGVFGQFYNPDGSPRGSEFQVNSYTTQNQFAPSVAMATDGSFVVAWTSYGQDGDHYGVFAQRFDGAGSPQGSEFPVNVYTTMRQAIPSVGRDGAGNFVIVWQSVGQDGSGFGVFGRRFDASGGSVGGEFAVNTFITGNQAAPSVGVGVDGSFLVVWQSFGQDGDLLGVFGRRFLADGTPKTGEFQINEFTTGSQSYPVAAQLADGTFVVAWQSQGEDGDNYGVFARGQDLIFGDGFE